MRNSRSLGIPSLITAATQCLDAGAHGITVHPRSDQRHIRSNDVFALAELLQEYPKAEFNIEGNPLHDLMPLLRQVRPHQCTFVPDSHEQATSDHGWVFPQDTNKLMPLVHEAQDLGIRVSLFMDADPKPMQAAKVCGADRIELYTEPWAQAHLNNTPSPTLQQFISAAHTANQVGLEVNAGHDLNLDNLGPLLQAIPQITEVSIGHAFTSDALEIGYQAATRAYLAVIDSVRQAISL